MSVAEGDCATWQVPISFKVKEEAMTPADIRAILGTRPFAPFRMFTSEGREYEVHHPDQVWIGGNLVIVSIPIPDGIDPNQYPGYQMLSLYHIVRIEHIPAQPV